MVTAYSVQKHQSKTRQHTPKYPACIGYIHGKVLCEFLIFSLKNMRTSQEMLPSQLSPSSTVVLQPKSAQQPCFCFMWPCALVEHFCSTILGLRQYRFKLTYIYTESKASNWSVGWQILPKLDHFTRLNAMYCNQMPILTDIKINFIKKEPFFFWNDDVHLEYI